MFALTAQRFGKLGFAILNGRVLSRWTGKDLGPASRLSVTVGPDVVTPSQLSAFGNARTPAFKRAVVTVVFPDGTRKSHTVTTHARPVGRKVTVPAPGTWPVDLVEMVRTEADEAMKAVRAAAVAEVMAEAEAKADAKARARKTVKTAAPVAVQRKRSFAELSELLSASTREQVA